jgi:Flp pilus assembly pilin Flp
MFEFISKKFTPTTEEERRIKPISFSVPMTLSGGVSSIWSGLGTTGKVLVGAGVGATGYAAYDWLFGGSKKTAPQEQQQQQEQTQKQQIPTNIEYKYNYSPTDIVNNTWNDYSRQHISNSPNSGISKKDSFTANTPINQNPVTPFSFAVTPSQDQAQQAKQDQAQGTDFTTIAVIAAVGLVAYGYTTSCCKRKRKTWKKVIAF